MLKNNGHFGEDYVDDQTCQNWFVKFLGDFSLNNDSHSGRSVEVDSDQIKTVVKTTESYTTWRVGSNNNNQNMKTLKIFCLLMLVAFMYGLQMLSKKTELDCIFICDSRLMKMFFFIVIAEEKRDTLHHERNRE